jgi:hypothetical protein
MTNLDPRVQQLDALALTRKARFYFCQRDNRFRILRNNTLHTFSGLTEAETLLVSLPIPEPDKPQEPRPRGVELYRMPQSVTSAVYRSTR